jgi:hypothetical protein
MKLTNLALLCAIFGPNATSATDAITGINDPRKRKLSSSEASSSASTKSAKFGKGHASNIDYIGAAAAIATGLGNNGCQQCGDKCYTMNFEAIGALEAIATGESDEGTWLTPVDYEFGVCNNNLECISRNPSKGFALTEAIALFSEAQDTCEGDFGVRHFPVLLAHYGENLMLMVFRCIDGQY